MLKQKQRTIAAHPGEILRAEFIGPTGITAYQLVKALHFPGFPEIVRERQAITGVPTSAALALVGVNLRRRRSPPRQIFRMTPQFWLNLQSDYDLRLAAARAPLSKIKPCSA